MKVLAGYFTTESNAHVPMKNDITDYVVAFGDECIQKMQVKEVFDQAGIEMIPAIYASAGASGVIKRETFDYIEACMVRAAREHLDEIDGVYLHLHGASEVEELGSGDHHILAAIRQVVGPYVPIAVCCDPHGNLCREYVENIQIIRSYRESPHTDSMDTMKKVAGMLCELLKNRQNIHSVYRKLPLILGGEQSVSTDEPVRSINAYMDELEKDPRILSCWPPVKKNRCNSHSDSQHNGGPGKRHKYHLYCLSIFLQIESPNNHTRKNQIQKNIGQSPSPFFRDQSAAKHQPSQENIDKHNNDLL